MSRPPKRARSPRKSVTATATGSRRPRRAPRRSSPPHRRLIVGLVVVGLSLVLGVSGLWLWGRSGPTVAANGAFQAVELPPNLPAAEVLGRLQGAKLVQESELLRAYQLVLHPWFEYAPGVHWLRPGHSADDLLQLVGRTRSRPVVRVALPEGWDSFQMAERLAAAGICAPAEFVAQVLGKRDTATTHNRSQEGLLYPASYDFRLNSAPGDVVERLNKEAALRFDRVFSTTNTQSTNLARQLGLGRDEVITLASVVEKEAANTKELGLIASVFLNRLSDPNFRPARMLQSDPTAGYGCKVYSDLSSCRAYTGRVTAAMLRDPNNPFNTYKHPGLPPSPIGNPSTASVEAVLNAPTTNYYFFVSHAGGPHHFSQTLEAHEAAIRTP